MDKYTIEEKTITKKIYTTYDGFEFVCKQDAYNHVAFKFREDILNNKINIIDLDLDLFRDENITSCKFLNKDELEMFLYSYLDEYTVCNAEEIKYKAQHRINFPCILCIAEDEIFFKEDLINRIENVLNAIREEL